MVLLIYSVLHSLGLRLLLVVIEQGGVRLVSELLVLLLIGLHSARVVEKLEVVLGLHRCRRLILVLLLRMLLLPRQLTIRVGLLLDVLWVNLAVQALVVGCVALEG